jgi:hypothetical protein
MMRQRVQKWFWLVVAFGVSMLPGFVQANVGPPSSGGQVVAEPVGIQEVEIRWEVLQIDLRPLAENEPALVSAEYQLENHGPEKSLNLLFASGSAEVSQLTVSLNEKPLPSRPAPETPLPESWQPPKETPGLHGDPPVSYLSYGSQPAIPYAMTVVIPEGSHKLRVQYRAEAAVHSYGQPTLYHQFAYILAPARAWSGFGGMDVTIQLPRDWSVSCNLPLQRTGDVLAGRFSELPADAIALTTQAAVSDSYVIANEGLFWLYLLSAVFGLAFCWKRGRHTGRELAKLPSESPPRRVWPTSLFAGVLAGLATFATGLLAIFVPDFLLPANQITHYGYGKVFYLFGVLYLSSNVVLIGFGVAQLTSRWFRKRIAV